MKKDKLKRIAWQISAFFYGLLLLIFGPFWMLLVRTFTTRKILSIPNKGLGKLVYKWRDKIVENSNFTLMALIFIGLFSCSANPTEKHIDQKIYGKRYEVIEIEGHEYLFVHLSLIHI